MEKLTAISNNPKIKKRLLILIVLFPTLWGCNNSTSKVGEIDEGGSEEALIKDDSLQIQTIRSEVIQKVDIESIKECAEQGITSFNMDSEPIQKSISTIQLLKMFLERSR